jgi:hypothetical protein
MQSSFGFPPVPRIRSAVSQKNEQGISGSAHRTGPPSTTAKGNNFTAPKLVKPVEEQSWFLNWQAIPIAERFELLATIREVREWRYGDCEPLRPLQPIRQAALALHQWLNRHADVR